MDMNQPMKKILFATDLSKEMLQVFEMAVRTAIAHKAGITILHVMEESPTAEQQLTIVFGEEKYQDLKSEQMERARETLVGKNLEAQRIRQAIADFFKEPDTTGKEAGDESLIQNIVVVEGRSVADDILSTASEENCDMIVMGSKKQGLIAEVVGKHVVRKVIKHSSIPILVVPYLES